MNLTYPQECQLLLDMTKYEKLSTILSVAAVIIAVLTPIGSYLWLDPQLQTFRHRPKLQVLLEEPTSSGTTMDYSDPNYPIFTVTGSNRIRIVNLGDLPAKDIAISGQYLQSEDATKSPEVTPPMPIDLTSNDNLQFISIRRPIAPHDKIEVSFENAPKVIWVSTEFGETSTIFTGTRAYMVNTKTQEEIPMDRISAPTDPSKFKAIKRVKIPPH